ncbi:MAG: hypothetical protein KKC80_08745 [Candidatus Margulisbacteria bacterium]|nr:hypothetical protein [Candidatus Margulisiibacteriota bacterium]
MPIVYRGCFIKTACICIPKTEKISRQENIERAILYIDGKDYGNVKIEDRFVIYELSKKFNLITWDSIHFIHVLISNNIELPKKIIDLRLLASSLGLCSRDYQYDEKYWGLFSSFSFESTFKKKISLKNIVDQYNELKATTSSSIFKDIENINTKLTQDLIPLLYNSHIIKQQKGKLAQHIYPVHEPLSQKNGRFLCYPNDLIFIKKEDRIDYVSSFNSKFISFDIIEASLAISRYFFNFFSEPIREDLYDYLEAAYGQPKKNTKQIISAYIFGASEQKIMQMIKSLGMIGNVMQAHFWHDLKNMIKRESIYFKIMTQIEEKGFLHTLNKRIRFFDRSQVLSAWSYIIHGNEADIIINSLIEINKKYPLLNIPIINGDEIIIETDNMSLESEIKEIIERNSLYFNIKVKT